MKTFEEFLGTFLWPVDRFDWFRELARRWFAEKFSVFPAETTKRTVKSSRTWKNSTRTEFASWSSIEPVEYCRTKYCWATNHNKADWQSSCRQRRRRLADTKGRHRDSVVEWRFHKISLRRRCNNFSENLQRFPRTEPIWRWKFLSTRCQPRNRRNFWKFSIRSAPSRFASAVRREKLSTFRLGSSKSTRETNLDKQIPWNRDESLPGRGSIDFLRFLVRPCLEDKLFCAPISRFHSTVDHKSVSCNRRWNDGESGPDLRVARPSSPTNICSKRKVGRSERAAKKKRLDELRQQKITRLMNEVS